jgi:hypothetical protein
METKRTSREPRFVDMNIWLPSIECKLHTFAQSFTWATLMNYRYPWAMAIELANETAASRMLGHGAMIHWHEYTEELLSDDPEPRYK